MKSDRNDRNYVNDRDWCDDNNQGWLKSAILGGGSSYKDLGLSLGGGSSYKEINPVPEAARNRI